MYKNMRISMGKMSFSKNFADTSRGDLYPLIEKSPDCLEKIENGSYCVSGTAKRMFCRYFPYANYETEAEIVSGKAGFCFDFPDFSVKIVSDGKNVRCVCGNFSESAVFPEDLSKNFCLCVSCRPGAFDIYAKIGGNLDFIHSFENEIFSVLNSYDIFRRSHACLYAEGEVCVSSVESFIDNGISIADIRPIRYENADVMTECGKIYLTASVRLEKEGFQGVFSWIPGTAELEMCGALFFDAGDGRWCGDVASSILYDRKSGKWLLWVCSFSHGHVLAHSSFDGDPRFGVNVIDVALMPKAPENAEISDFYAFEGDEDPDFFYDEKKNRWLMSICRLNPETHKYAYVFFESSEPFGGYGFIGKGEDGCETGGSFAKLDGKVYFVCGNDFEKKSDYRIYSEDGIKTARFDFPDGGFRGWGTVVSIKLAGRTRVFWLTFDRTLGSRYNWSYGNLYCFEA